MLSVNQLAQFIDHTLLSPTAEPKQILKLCEEAREWSFYSVCVNPFFLPLCRKQLVGSPVNICTVIGFPLGQNTLETKVYEAKQAQELGANELDMVLNIAALKSGDLENVKKEIIAVRREAPESTLKVIIETCLLDTLQIELATLCCEEAGADFVKTSTGFSSKGATLEDIETIKKARKTDIKIKASGGIRDLNQALKFIEAGVHRLGTSKSVEIIKSLNELQSR